MFKHHYGYLPDLPDHQDYRSLISKQTRESLLAAYSLVLSELSCYNERIMSGAQRYEQHFQQSREPSRP
jgi:hypothetical protein